MEPDYIGIACTIILSLIICGVYKNYVAPYRHKYLTFWPRFWAPTIDEVILWIPVSLLPFVIYKMAYLENHAGTLLSMSVYLIYYLYSIYLHKKYGATFGKMVTRVKVVDAVTEGPITFKQAIIRDLIPAMFSISLIAYLLITGDSELMDDSAYTLYMPLILLGWFLAEIITMLTNKKRRALHDFLAGTVVIRSNTEKKPS